MIGESRKCEPKDWCAVAMGEPDQTLNRADPRKYIQLAAGLRRRIRDGTLRVGNPAPSITALAAEHGGWARQTVGKAFRILEAEGLLVRVAGLGYFIADPDSSAMNQPPILIVADLLHTGAGAFTDARVAVMSRVERSR